MKSLRQACALVSGLFLFLIARGQSSYTGQHPVSSVSGQFLVSTVPGDDPGYRDAALRDPNLLANTNLVRLKPAFLAVAAERFKISVWDQLGLPASSSWSGKIYLRVHPARSLNETVTITSSPFRGHWDYGLELPDTLSKTRYARALAGVVLLELANRSAQVGGHTAELPDWLVDGLAEQVLGANGDRVVLSAPAAKGDELAIGRINQTQRGFDALAAARQIVQSLPVLTFDQLSWPTDAQMAGADGGAYFASAQLFQSELLRLPAGREKMRALLAALPGHLNWQTAFFQAFGDDFKRPLDVEKWWALRVVNFAARAPGPRWTTEVSLVRLQQLMSVPVEFRGQPDAMPTHAEISLQDALKSLDPAQRDLIMRLKVRDLALIELRLAPPFGDLADGYRLVLADFLGVLNTPGQVTVTNKRISWAHYNATLPETLKKLDALDIRRRNAEARAIIPLRGNPRAGGP